MSYIKLIRYKLPYKKKCWYFEGHAQKGKNIAKIIYVSFWFSIGKKKKSGAKSIAKSQNWFFHYVRHYN